LSTENELEIDMCSFYEDEDFNLILTRRFFEKLCAHLFDKFLPIVKKVLLDSQMEKSKVDEVIFVGGSTRIPKFQEIFWGFFDPKQISKSVYLDNAVAVGATIQAAILNKECNKLGKVYGIQEAP
jgi:heat shock protein 1/8